MVRSAKMKLATPPKLMPPFHNTAASGMLPIVQTNAASGPISGQDRTSAAPARERRGTCCGDRTRLTASGLSRCAGQRERPMPAPGRSRTGWRKGACP